MTCILEENQSGQWLQGMKILGVMEETGENGGGGGGEEGPSISAVIAVVMTV